MALREIAAAKIVPTTPFKAFPEPEAEYAIAPDLLLPPSGGRGRGSPGRFTPELRSKRYFA